MADRIQLGDINPEPSKLLKRIIGITLRELASEWNSPETPNKAESLAALKQLLELLEGHNG
jgi:hypothetical protein|tara:strand:- start:1055 stop:1237 length:183 start_codon:yes stop_codon:yes gene_type:complete